MNLRKMKIIFSDCLKRIQKTMDDKTLNNQMVLECFQKKNIGDKNE